MSSRKKIKTLCSFCKREISGEVDVKDKVTIIKCCPEHGQHTEEHFVSDKAVYSFLSNLHRNRSGRPEGLILKVTERCNQKCTFCYMDAESTANHADHSKEPTAECIIQKAQKFKGDVIYLSGGEPTIRQDLPLIIKSIKKLKYKVILFSNGKKLADINYVRELKKAGLSSVILQFNSMNEKTNFNFFNENVLENKISAVQNMHSVGLHTMLYVNCVNGYNTDSKEICDLFHFASNMPNVKLLFFNPLWEIGRKDEVTSNVNAREMLSKVCDELSVTKESFFNSISISTYIFELLRFLGIRRGIKQPPCSVSTYYIRTANGPVQLDEILDTKEIISELEVIDNKLDNQGIGIRNLLRLLISISFYRLIFKCMFNYKLIALIFKAQMMSVLKRSSWLYFMNLNIFSVMVGQFPSEKNMDYSLFKSCNMHTEYGDNSLPTCLREVFSNE